MRAAIKKMLGLSGLTIAMGKLLDQVDDLTWTMSPQWRLALLDRPRYRDTRRLCHHEYQVFSQNGEDGCLAEVFRRIGVTNRYFVEFGAGDGLENNTSHLLLGGWSGLWIEVDLPSCEKIRTGMQRLLRSQRLLLTNARVDIDNIEHLFQDAGVPQRFDLLS
ncbi:MAG TPA: hypothetical protein VMF29_07840, partial [Candidatus Edwardsbacteria bacterium]|nr:hypothetical protein [Candidatus Edwardsbacteria bacterium]